MNYIRTYRLKLIIRCFLRPDSTLRFRGLRGTRSTRLTLLGYCRNRGARQDRGCAKMLVAVPFMGEVSKVLLVPGQGGTSALGEHLPPGAGRTACHITP